jgi:hypothetical protein
MKKIMFNEKYGLTNAVLAGIKTKTRRVVPNKYQTILTECWEDAHSSTSGCTFLQMTDVCYIINKAPYKVGEKAAIAQKYYDIWQPYLKETLDALDRATIHLKAGWDNKMFVRSEFMPHHILFKNLSIERLQDISDTDCLAEGIDVGIDDDGRTIWRYYDSYYFDSPKDAYAALIDAISGKGTWERNPWVFVYTFSLSNSDSNKEV